MGHRKSLASAPWRVRKPHPLETVTVSCRSNPSLLSPLVGAGPKGVERMDARDLEAFAQFLQMNGMVSGQPAGKAKPSFMETFQGKATASIGLFVAAIFAFRNFGDSLA
jgi:hypothetical protein